MVDCTVNILSQKVFMKIIGFFLQVICAPLLLFLFLLQITSLYRYILQVYNVIRVHIIQQIKRELQKLSMADGLIILKMIILLTLFWEYFIRLNKSFSDKRTDLLCFGVMPLSTDFNLLLYVAFYFENTCPIRFKLGIYNQHEQSFFCKQE